MILYDHISPFSTFHFLVIPILRRQLCCKMRCVVVVFISSSHFLTSRNHDLRIYQIWVSLMRLWFLLNDYVSSKIYTYKPTSQSKPPPFLCFSVFTHWNIHKAHLSENFFLGDVQHFEIHTPPPVQKNIQFT